MKNFPKKIYLILFLLIIMLNTTKSFSIESRIEYSGEKLSNYFSGIVSANQADNKQAFYYLNKVKSLKNSHTNFNIQFIRTLILVEKFDEAFEFTKDVWNKEESYLEIELLMGLESFIKKDYFEAEKYFKRLNNSSNYNIFFEDFLGNLLLSWNKAIEGNKEESFEYLKRIPNRYDNLKNLQNIFLQCYFDTPETEIFFDKLLNEDDNAFSRYNFFLANYLLYKNQNAKAKETIISGRKINNSNLLLKQAENFIESKNEKKIRNLFNCKNPKDSIAEIFYVLANLYATEKDYQLSNFYLKLSLFLNDKFLPNKTLLAENFYFQKKFNESKKIYNSLKSVGTVYSWYASKNIAIISLKESKKDISIAKLKKEFNLLPYQNVDHYHELANFLKENEYYEESIKYYSLALEKIKSDHVLFPKILHKRGTSYERIGQWQKAEKDLLESLKILPNQPFVLNYLGYSWIEKKMHIKKALKMLKEATKLKENDGYIIDSLGWAYFANKNYIDAEIFLQRAVELMPFDPVINDHYADVLWMLNKNIQARYFWNHALNLEDTEQKLKDSINKKLIFGIVEKL